MPAIKILGYAKINLALDILGKRPDGYHEVEMIMQSVSLADEIILTSCAQGISITTDNNQLANDSSNLAYRAARLLQTEMNISRGVHINLIKNIPLAAGLAGGSTDAAAVLKGLNELWELNLSKQQLETFGAQLGSDVPFCLTGKTMLAVGRGEKVLPLPQYPESYVVLAKPAFSVSTAWVYQNYRPEKVNFRPNMKILLQALKEKNRAEFIKHTANVLESVTIVKYPIIQEIKKTMLVSNASLCLMSGSGPTVFGLFDSKEEAEKAAYNVMRYDKVQVFIAKTL